MKRLFAILIFLLLPVSGWGASTTYYVSPSGDNTTGTSWATAFALPSQAVTAGNSVAPTAKTPGAGHLIYIAPGTYDSNLTLSNANWAGGTVTGTSAHGATTNALMDQVKLEYTGADHGCNPGQDNITLNNISCKSTGTAKDGIALTSTNTVINNLHAYDSTRHSLHSSGGTSFTVNRSKFTGSGTNAVTMNTTASGTFNYCIVGPSETTASLNPTGRLYAAAHSANTVTWNNSIFEGVQYTNAPIYQSGAGTTTFNNCVITGAINPNTATVERAAGTVNINNSYIGYNWWSTHNMFSGTIAVDSNNIKTSHPYFRNHLYKGIVVPCVDDYSNNDVVTTLEPIFSSRGIGGTWYVESDDVTASAETKAIVQGVINRGIFEVGVHSKTHSDLNRTSSDVVFSITKGGANITVDRDTDGGTITISGAGTVTGFRAKTLAAIKTELEALGCTVGAYLSNQDSTALGEIMANLTTGASPQNVLYLIDATAATGLYKVEVKDAYDAMIANFTGYTPYSFATPYGSTNANLEAAIAAVGFTSSRISGTDARAEKGLTSIDLMQTSFYLNSTLFDGGTDALNEAYMSAVLVFLANKPGIVYLLGHGTGEFSIANWTLLANTISSFNSIHKFSARDASAYIKNSGLWSTGDNRTYTRTYTNASNYSLYPSSTLINAGTNLCATLVTATDYAGNPVCTGSSYVGKGGAPEIGAYEYIGGKDVVPTDPDVPFMPFPGFDLTLLQKKEESR